MLVPKGGTGVKAGWGRGPSGDCLQASSPHDVLCAILGPLQLVQHAAVRAGEPLRLHQLHHQLRRHCMTPMNNMSGEQYRTVQKTPVKLPVQKRYSAESSEQSPLCI